MSVKTESLSDVLRDLCDLAPNSFETHRDPLRNRVIAHVRVGKVWDAVIEDVRPVTLSWIEYACREVCDVRGWNWEIVADLSAEEWERYACRVRHLDYRYADTPALAISTALRDVLREEEL